MFTLLALLGCTQDCQEGYGRDSEGNCVLLGAADDTGDADDTGPPEDTAPPEELDASIMTLGDPVACDDPMDEPRYTEVGASMGLTGNAASTDHGEWGSAAVFDVDADGDMDIALAFPDQPITLYRRDGAGFTAEALGGPSSPWHLSLADVDGDGDLDLLSGGYGHLDETPDEPGLLLNEGGDLVAADFPARPSGTNGAVRELAPGDLDGDGDLDLYASVTLFAQDYSEGDQVDYLLINDGAGGFTPDTAALPASLSWGRAFDAQWIDYDGDGDQDLYVGNDMGDEFVPNVMYRNDDGSLTDVSEDCFCGLEVFTMGVDFADMNGDAIPDIYVTAGGNNVYLQSLPDNTYVDASQNTAANPLPGSWQMGWGGLMIDVTNDGLRDILVTQGDLWGADEVVETPVNDLPINVLQNNGVTFIDNAQVFGIEASGSWRAVVAVDHNGDGVVDPLFVDAVQAPLLYLSDGCTSASWLAVEAPVGSAVEVTANGVTQTAWVTTDASCGGAKPARVHFGLGDATEVSALSVTLPGGDAIVRAEEPFAPRRIVAVDPTAE